MFRRRKIKTMLFGGGVTLFALYLLNSVAITQYAQEKGRQLQRLVTTNQTVKTAIPPWRSSRREKPFWTRPETKLTPFQKSSAVQLSRRNQVMVQCDRNYGKNRTHNPAYLDNKVHAVNRRYPFLHCSLTKAASTFWGRFVLRLNTSGPMLSPFSYRLTFNGGLPLTRLLALGARDARAKFVEASVKNMFVRDPFHRMFSAYVDKIVGPNPYFWKEWGTAWSRMNRARLPPSRQRTPPTLCHHELSFAQAMAAAAVSLHRTDIHFKPASVQCQPCDLRYDVIGKMESFPQDLVHLSQLMNLSLTSYFSGKEFRYDYVKDAIEDSVYSPFTWERSITRCISKHVMGLRIWRKLQIRGIIDRRIEFPFTAERFKTVKGAQLVEAALRAHLNSTDREELSRQKRDAFVEAYRAVELKDLNVMKAVFLEDFAMFGYDSAPRDVFDRRWKLNSTGAFDYAKPWKG